MIHQNESWFSYREILLQTLQGRKVEFCLCQKIRFSFSNTQTAYCSFGMNEFQQTPDNNGNNLCVNKLKTKELFSLRDESFVYNLESGLAWRIRGSHDEGKWILEEKFAHELSFRCRSGKQTSDMLRYLARSDFLQYDRYFTLYSFFSKCMLWENCFPQPTHICISDFTCHFPKLKTKCLPALLRLRGIVGNDARDSQSAGLLVNNFFQK